MPRFCRDCGRDVHDPDEHEKIDVTIVDENDEKVGVEKRRRCRNLVLVADQTAVDLVTGRRIVRNRYVPTKHVEIDGEQVEVMDPQRTRFNNTRRVHRDTLAAQDRSAA
jgi:hypothetical protein